MTRETIAGFVLERLLGRGAHGEVWLARGSAGDQVALKLLKPLPHADVEAKRRFEREIRATTAISHPNVVRTFESGTWNERPFLVCELVPGGSLQELLDREGRLGTPRVLELAVGILRGLCAIHRAGLVHRDIKPQNVLLGADLTPKIADLGLARATAPGRTQLTAQGDVVGTPAYMSPEQIEHGEDVDIRSDLYSLGVVLYQLVTGELPFTGDSILDLLEAHLHEPVPDPRRKATLPAAVASLIMGLMAKRRDERPRDPAAALALVESQASLFRGAGLPFAATLADPAPQTRTAALRLRADGGPILFVYGHEDLVFGRENVAGDPRRICLRVLPAAQNAERSLRISNRHLGIRRRDGRWYVRDLQSTHGTQIDGARLAPDDEVELVDQATLDLAGVLTLRATLLPRASGAPSGALVAPSLLLERIGNGSHHRYLCVCAPVALDLAQRPVRLGAGPWILASEGNFLRWLASGPPAAMVAAPQPIEPEDPKS